MPGNLARAKWHPLPWSPRPDPKIHQKINGKGGAERDTQIPPKRSPGGSKNRQKSLNGGPEMATGENEKTKKKHKDAWSAHVRGRRQRQMFIRVRCC